MQDISLKYGSTQIKVLFFLNIRLTQKNPKRVLRGVMVIWRVRKERPKLHNLRSSSPQS